MALADVLGKNLGVSLVDRFALYIEGALCAFSRVELIIEDGLVPRLAISVPATDEMATLNRRVRVHLIHRELINEQGAEGTDWVVLFEGEIRTRGFRKSPSSRDVTFMAVHVTSLLEQFALLALDTPGAILAQMKGVEATTPVISFGPGKDPLSQFMPEVVAGMFKPAKDPKNLTFRDWLEGSFLMYQNLLESSRISQSWFTRAVRVYDLFDRIFLPDPKLLDWDAFYSRLLQQMMVSQAADRGSRLSYLDLVRTLAAEFLYQVTINPHAESCTKQIQVKPMTHFNAVPRCNVIYPSLTDDWVYEEQTKITRMQGQFYPAAGLMNEDSIEMARTLTVFAPTELQWRWLQIQSAPQGPTVASASTVSLGGVSLKFVPPKDGIAFVTREEEAVGIYPDYYDLPKTLTHAISALLTHGMVLSRGSASAGIAAPAAAALMTEAATTVTGTLESQRLAKYRAFISQALGHGSGIDADRFGGKRYRQPGTHILRLATSGTSVEPMAVAFLGLDVHPKRKPGGGPAEPDEVIGTGCNYFIAADGTIIEILPREHFLFAESPQCPFGLRIKGLSAYNAGAYNAQMPHVGFSRKASSGVSAAEDRWTGTLKPTWSVADGWPPMPGHAKPTGKGPFDQLAFAVNADGGALLTGAGWDRPQLNDFQLMKKGEDAVVVRPQGLNNRETTLLDWQFLYAGSDPKQGGFDWVWFKFKDKVVDASGMQTIMVKSRSTLVGDKHPGRPWILIPETASKPVAGPLPQAHAPKDLATMIKEDKGIKRGNPDNPGYILGGDRMILIGVEMDKSQRIDAKAIDAAAYVLACVKELQVETAGTNDKPTNTFAQRRGKITDAQIHGFKQHLPKETQCKWLPDIKDTVASIKQKAALLQEAMYKDFCTWDKELIGSATKPAKPLGTAKAGAATFDPTTGDPTHRGDSGAAAMVLAGLAVEPPPLPKIDEAEAAHFIDLYAAPVMNAQFYYRRYAPQGFTGNCVFNPYLLVGYPALLIDNSVASYNLIGYVHGLTHSIEPERAWTSVTYTHLRPATMAGEAIIPYSKARTQPHRVTLVGKIKGETPPAPDSEAYLKTVPSISSHLPVELYTITRKVPPPFMYDGGFGLGKGVNVRDFSRYLESLGYGKTQESKLVFQDAIEFRSMAGLSAEEKQTRILRHDPTAREAMKLAWRPISKVGQTNKAKARASRVSFSRQEIEIPEPLGHEAITRPPSSIVMFTQASIHKWNAEVRKAVLSHTEAVMQKRARIG